MTDHPGGAEGPDDATDPGDSTAPDDATVPDPVDVRAALDSVDDYWSPRIAGELNGQHVKLAKLSGAFDWHHHADADELFYVLSGELRIEFRDGEVTVDEEEFVVVPAGVDHRPVADEEAHVLLFEPAGTRNTGNVESDRTVEDLERL